MLVRMLRSATRWAALSVLALGCSAEDASDPNEGGQTGSLVPPTCAQEALNPFVVPEGQTAFVEGWHAFSNPLLEDETGNVIATSVIQDDNTALVRTETALPAGDYTLSYDCDDSKMPVQRTISVAEAAPLPTAFGELGVVVSTPRPLCEELAFVSLVWTPPYEFLAYLDLVQLTFSVDGVEVGRVPLAEPLSADLGGKVSVDIPTCHRFDAPCGVTAGTYTLQAKIAGRSDRWGSPEVVVDGLCRPEDAGCAVSNANVASSGSGWWFVIAAAWVRLRHAKRRSVTQAPEPRY